MFRVRKSPGDRCVLLAAVVRSCLLAGAARGGESRTGMMSGTVTTVGAEVAEQPAALYAVTVKLPELLTVMDCVVAPLDHE